MARKRRTKIPAPVSRQIKVEAGHQCGVWRCQQTAYLHQHHIDGNPANHDAENIILLCRQHHALADDGEISRLELIEYKNKLKQMLTPQIEPESGAIPEVKHVDLNYPADSGLQARYEQDGYKLRWSSDSKLARRLDLDGWQYAYQKIPNGKCFILKDPMGELTLIAKKN